MLPAVPARKVALREEDDDDRRVAHRLLQLGDVLQVDHVEPDADAGQQQLQLPHECVGLLLARGEAGQWR